MKLRVRILRRTSRLDLPGPEPSVAELTEQIREQLLSSHGLGSDTEFSLSLNGSELLSGSGQTLASCGIVSGDLICVLLPQSAEPVTTATRTTTSSSVDQNQNQQTDSETPSQSSFSPAAPLGPEDPDPMDAGHVTSVWEPMLCCEAEEGGAPLSLELLYQSAGSTCPSDTIMVAAHLLMIETGFIPQVSPVQVSPVQVSPVQVSPAQMPAGWRSPGGVFRLQYLHPLCGGAVVSLLAVSLGPVLSINTTLKVTENVETPRKLCLNPSSYVTDEWPGGNAAAAFRDLRKLSRVFKDQLVYPLIAAARDAMSLPVAFGLQVLPPELLLRILRLLDVRSVVRLSAASRHFSAATADPSLWRHLYLRDFSDGTRSRDSDWKELYKKSYKRRCDLRHSFRRLPHDLPDFMPPPPPCFPPLPGIIGGEYDQRPSLPRGLLPRPRYDPIGPLADPNRRRHDFLRGPPSGANIRRGFI